MRAGLAQINHCLSRRRDASEKAFSPVILRSDTRGKRNITLASRGKTEEKLIAARASWISRCRVLGVNR